MVYKRSMKKRTFRKRPVRKSKTTTLATLQKQVRLLQKKTKLVTQDVSYRVNEAIDVVSPYVVRNLTNYSSWAELFPSGLSTVEKNEAYIKHIHIDNLITLDNVNNEEGTINFTYMVISRKDEAGTATDTVNSLSLTNNIDYSLVAGKSYMNLRKWKVHYVKRFTLTQMDADSSTQVDASQCQRRFAHKIKIGKKVVNPDGFWKSLENSPDPSDTYYAILFNDNSAADLESPRWDFNSIASVNC